MNDIIEMTVYESVQDVATIEVDAVEGIRADKYNLVDSTIKDVHLIGLKAKNAIKPNTQPYSYKEAALKEAAPLYDNVDIYVDHLPGMEARSVTDKIGFISNPVFKEGLGVFGDITLNPKHVAYEAVVWWAKNKPAKLGMSHVARTQYDAKENAMVKIAKVFSVDLVSEGSTTHDGLFKEGVLVDKINSEKWLDILIDTAWNAVYEIKYPLGKSLTQEEKAVKIAPVIKDLLDELSKMLPAKVKESVVEPTEIKKKDNNMEFADITLETLTKNRKDLVTAIESKAVETYIEVEEAVADAIKIIPEDARSTTFTKLVREAVVAGNDKLVNELVADRKELTGKQTAVVEAAPAARTRIDKKTETKALDVKSIGAMVKQKN
jgi:hypothetical protein